MKSLKKVIFFFIFFRIYVKLLVYDYLISITNDIEPYKLVFISQLLVSRVHHSNETFVEIIISALARIAYHFPLQVSKI